MRVVSLLWVSSCCAPICLEVCVSVRNPDSSGMPVVNKKCKLCTFVENRNVYLAGTYWRYICLYYTIHATKKGLLREGIGLFIMIGEPAHSPIKVSSSYHFANHGHRSNPLKSRQGFAPCMAHFTLPSGWAVPSPPLRLLFRHEIVWTLVSTSTLLMLL